MSDKKIFENKKISLKKASFSDIEFLWYLRNQLGVCKYSRQSRKVSWKEHIEWIMPIIFGTTNKELFIIKNFKIPIGQVRFDWANNKKVEISISISKEFQRKGFAFKSLNLAIEKIKKEKRAQELTAEINKNNIPSIKLFEKLNFKRDTKKENWLKYTLDL